MIKYICIKRITDSMDCGWHPNWGFERTINNDVVYNPGDIIELDEKTMMIDGDYKKDFFKHFKHLKSLKMEDYFIPYEPIRKALYRNDRIDELFEGDEEN